MLDQKKSVHVAFYILNSDGCSAESWHLRRTCNPGLATDSAVALTIFTNDYDTQDAEIRVYMSFHQMIR